MSISKKINMETARKEATLFYKDIMKNVITELEEIKEETPKGKEAERKDIMRVVHIDRAIVAIKSIADI